MTNNLCFTLNAHLPFVRHPEYPKFLEEDWFYEAVNESYLPILRMFYRLRDEKVPFHMVFFRTMPGRLLVTVSMRTLESSALIPFSYRAV